MLAHMRAAHACAGPMVRAATAAGARTNRRALHTQQQQQQTQSAAAARRRHVAAQRAFSSNSSSSIVPPASATASSASGASPTGTPHAGAPSASAAAAGASGAAVPPAAAAAAAPLSDAGSEFVLVDPSKAADADPPSTWRTKLAAFMLAGGLAYHVYSERSEALAAVNRDVVSCLPSEIHDLINVFHFTTKDMESLYAKTMQRYPRGQVSVDDFSQLLLDQSVLVKERRRRQRDERLRDRLQSQYWDDREEVKLEREVERAQRRVEAGDANATVLLSALQKQLAARRAANEAGDNLRERDAAADELEAHADAHVDNNFNVLDAFILYRTSPIQSFGPSPTYLSPAWTGKTPPFDPRKAMVDVRDLMLGVANLLFDHADLAERFEERRGQKNIPASLEALQAKWSARDVETFTRRPESRLHFAFRVTDEDRDGHITFAELTNMMRRLMRTGHIKAESLLRHKHKRPTTPQGTLIPPPTTTTTALAQQQPLTAAAVAAAAAALTPDPFASDSTPLLPYRFEQVSAEDIAFVYWEQIQMRRRIDALQQLKQRQANSDAAAPAAGAGAGTAATAPLPALDVYSPSSRLTWPELLAASRHLSNSGASPAFWYLGATFPNGGATGSFWKWRHKWALRVRQRWNRVPTTADADDVDQAMLVAFATP